jgi:hypothetical protein
VAEPSSAVGTDAERERINRTRFAQRALKPEEVQRELEATDAVLGDPAAVREFFARSRSAVRPYCCTRPPARRFPGGGDERGNCDPSRGDSVGPTQIRQDWLLARLSLRLPNPRGRRIS